MCKVSARVSPGLGKAMAHVWKIEMREVLQQTIEEIKAIGKVRMLEWTYFLRQSPARGLHSTGETISQKTPSKLQIYS